MNVRSRSTLLMLMVLALGACSSAVRQPEVTLEGVRIGTVGLRGGTLYAQVHITNPNGFDLETESMTYDLQIPDEDEPNRWVSFAEGTITERVRVREHSSTTVEVPVQFRYDDLGGAVRSMLDTGTFNYRVRGDVRLARPIGRTIPYSKTGTVSLDGIR